MADFTVTQADLTEAVTFLEQFLATSLPQYDFSRGTAARDIAIDSMSYIVAFFRKEIADIRNRQTLLRLTEATEGLSQDSADELVDEILSDWFIGRKTGGLSTGYVTLKFAKQQIGVVTFTQDDTFTRTGRDFTIIDETATIQSTDLTRNTDNLGIEFFTATLQLVATAVGSEFDIEPGPFEEFPQVSPHLLSIENLEKFLGGEGVETSEEMVVRSESAITARDLTKIPAINTVLTDTFVQVKEVVSMGLTDPEMQRDLINVPSGSGTVAIHRGSMMDIYIKYPLEFHRVYTAVFPAENGLLVQNYTVNGSTIAAVKLPQYPFYKLHSLKDKTVTPAVTVPFVTVVADQYMWNSDRQDIYLQVSSSYLNTYLDLEYDTVTGHTAVSEFVSDRRNRTIVSDPLVKSAYAMYLAFEIRYYQGSTAIPDLVAAKNTMQSFIHQRALGLEFKVSEITCYFADSFPTNSPQLPFVVVGSLLLPNGKILTMTFDDRIRAPEKYYYDEGFPDDLFPLFPGEPEPGDKVVVLLSDLQVSTRTIRFIVDTADIKLTSVT